MTNALLGNIYQDWIWVNNSLMFNRSTKNDNKTILKLIDLILNYKVNLFWKDIYVVKILLLSKNKIIIVEK